MPDNVFPELGAVLPTLEDRVVIQPAPGSGRNAAEAQTLQTIKTLINAGAGDGGDEAAGVGGFNPVATGADADTIPGNHAPHARAGVNITGDFEFTGLAAGKPIHAGGIAFLNMSGLGESEAAAGSIRVMRKTEAGISHEVQRFPFSPPNEVSAVGMTRFPMVLDKLRAEHIRPDGKIVLYLQFFNERAAGGADITFALSGADFGSLSPHFRAWAIQSIAAAADDGEDADPAEPEIGSSEINFAAPPAGAEHELHGFFLSQASANGTANAYPAGAMTGEPAESHLAGVEVPPPAIADNEATFADDAIRGLGFGGLAGPQANGRTLILGAVIQFKRFTTSHELWAGADGFSVQVIPDPNNAAAIMRIEIDGTGATTWPITAANRPAVNTWTKIALFFERTANGYEVKIVLGGEYYSATIITNRNIPAALNFGCEWQTDYTALRRRFIGKIRDLFFGELAEAPSQAQATAIGAEADLADRGNPYNNLVLIQLQSLSRAAIQPNVLSGYITMAHADQEITTGNLASDGYDIAQAEELDFYFSHDRYWNPGSYFHKKFPVRHIYIITHAANLAISSADLNTWRGQGRCLTLAIGSDSTLGLWRGNKTGGGGYKTSLFFIADEAGGPVRRIATLRAGVAAEQNPANYARKHLMTMRPRLKLAA